MKHCLANRYQIKTYDLVINKNMIDKYLYILRDGEAKNRSKNIEFHIQYDDYFVNLATVLDLIVQDEKSFKNKNYLHILNEIKDDLLYLHKNYHLVQRNALKK